MTVKDKVVFGLFSLLIIAAGYFQWLSNDMKSRMEELNTADVEHVNIIDKEFRESLRKYNIKFEGRGKHIRKAQEDIIANLELINQKSQELKDLIDNVQYNLDEYSRITDKKIDRTNNDLIDLQDSFDSQNRQDRRKFADIEQKLTQLQNEINELKPDEEEEEEPSSNSRRRGR
ncbi:MAG: hypothetical protein CMG08_04825 [Candidatus Marinimicrobia bacterium]|nr:hypothetical protein [Candidatus Neomarinimicrobiota bacterium]